jgi:hypothetical protein
MVDTTLNSDSDFQQTVESLIKARPDLMEPERLQLFEKMLNSHIENRRTDPELEAHDSASKPAAASQRPVSKFTAAAMDSCAAYILTALVAVIFPAVPLFLLPVIAVAGFLASRYWALYWDSSSKRHSH